ncbi:MAG TPA: alpha/beta hydrolase [Terriglobales bacterium]|jgi:acetyl esterase/lipase|nr:alpha/beta hydrolase [Terriglobales bacterium]
MSAEDILAKPQPPPDERIAYGDDPNHFFEVRLPRTKPPHPVLLNIHGGFWRAKYDLTHAGHLCEALRTEGLATFNLEYRRVGNVGGGWPGTFDDIRAAYRFIQQSNSRFHLDLGSLVVMGHSAGGQLALCLAAHEPSLHRVISLAGVVGMKKALALHLSNDAVAEFLGGKPEAVPDHYREADPMELTIRQARQWLIHGSEDEVVPPEFSRDYAAHKKKAGESVELLEIPHAGHFDLIDPSAEAFKEVKRVLNDPRAPLS